MSTTSIGNLEINVYRDIKPTQLYMDLLFKEMKPLSFLIGKWNTEGQIKAEGEMPAINIKGTDSYEWVLNGSFILHKVDVMMGEDRTEAFELIGEFDSISRTYKMRSFDNHGSFTTMEAIFDESGALHILGDNMRAKLSVYDSNNMSAQWEKLVDSKNWQSWMDLRFSK